jgi:hypothetical protein
VQFSLIPFVEFPHRFCMLFYALKRCLFVVPFFIPDYQRKEVAPLIRRILGLLSRPQQRRSSLNSALLEQHRNDVFVLMHQQLGGLR